MKSMYIPRYKPKELKLPPPRKQVTYHDHKRGAIRAVAVREGNIISYLDAENEELVLHHDEYSIEAKAKAWFGGLQIDEVAEEITRTEGKQGGQHAQATA